MIHRAANMSKPKAKAAAVVTDKVLTITPTCLADWSKWLKKNHLSQTAVHLIHWKAHTGKSTLRPMQAMKEAIRWGWIDTIVKSLGPDQYQQKFAKRNKSSKWSDNTLKYAEEMVKDESISMPGLEAYAYGLLRPRYNENVPQSQERLKGCALTKKRLAAVAKLKKKMIAAAK